MLCAVRRSAGLPRRAWLSSASESVCTVCNLQSKVVRNGTQQLNHGSRIRQERRALSTSSRICTDESKKPSSPDSSSATGTEGKRKGLPEILADSIRASGPMTVATYMRSSLLDPAHGYYTSSHKEATAAAEEAAKEGRHVIGAKGDFITSPEISQVFGELLAVYFVARWQSIGEALKASGKADVPIRLIELGPGRGTLLADVLRTFTTFKDVGGRLRKIHLVETSDGLKRLQEQAIRSVVEQRAGMKVRVLGPEDDPATVPGEGEVIVQWFNDIHEVPVESQSFTMGIAHEFFDALPIHIFQKVHDGFREVLVGLKDQQRSSGGSGVVVLKGKEIAAARSGNKADPAEPEFQFVLSPTATPWSMLLAARNQRFSSMQPGQRVEVSPESWAVARRFGELVAGREAMLPETPAGSVGDEKMEELIASDRQRRINSRKTKDSIGGVGVIIDYGDDKAASQSFRAFKSHKIVDPLVSPGSADLTANVDFAHLKHALASTDASAHGPMLQAHFLSALGLKQRIEALMRSAPDDTRAKDINSAAMRLVDMTGMGKEYKMLGVSAEPTAALDTSSEKSSEMPAQQHSSHLLYPFDLQQ